MKNNNSKSFISKIKSAMQRVFLFPFFLIYATVVGALNLIRMAHIKGFAVLTVFPYAAFYLCNNSEVLWGIVTMLFVLFMIYFSYNVYARDQENEGSDNFFDRISYKDERISPKSDSQKVDSTRTTKVKSAPVNGKSLSKGKSKKVLRKDDDLDWLLAEKSKMMAKKAKNN